MTIMLMEIIYYSRFDQYINESIDYSWEFQ